MRSINYLKLILLSIYLRYFEEERNNHKNETSMAIIDSYFNKDWNPLFISKKFNLPMNQVLNNIKYYKRHNIIKPCKHLENKL